MFLQIAVQPALDSTAYDYLQAAEAPVMEGLFAKYISDLMAENATRAAAQKLPFNIAQIDIAGGGDGHTFVVTILKTTATIQVSPDVVIGWAADSLVAARAVFWMGANADALTDYSENALVALQKGTEDVTDFFVGLAGSAKGTRFMGFAAGLVELL